MMNDRTRQDATHAWAEAHFDHIGWVGFDISNGHSPDQRYIRVATGLDYRDAAPVRGMRYGAAQENLVVQLQVRSEEHTSELQSLMRISYAVFCLKKKKKKKYKTKQHSYK